MMFFHGYGVLLLYKPLNCADLMFLVQKKVIFICLLVTVVSAKLIVGSCFEPTPLLICLRDVAQTK